MPGNIVQRLLDMLPYGVLQCFLEKPKEMEIAWVRRQSDPAMNKKAQLEKLTKINFVLR